MAPISAVIVSSIVYNLNFHKWSLSASSIFDQAAQTASETPVVSDVWTWLVSIFAAMGSFFTANWSDVRDWVSSWWTGLSEFLSQPDIHTILIVWIVVFWVCLFIPLLLGFGPAGILAGSLAAGFQSWMYGAFTPAGGVFAVFTSIGMMGVFCPPAIIAASTIASIAAGIAWVATAHT